MKSMLISDNRDTYLAMRLAGISGVILHEREEILEEFNRLIKEPEVGIIIITELVLEKIYKEVMEFKIRHNYPLVVEIPDRHGSRRGSDYITGYIRESIGIKI